MWATIQLIMALYHNYEVKQMGKKRKNQLFWQSALSNNATYEFYYNALLSLALSRFEWRGLPSGVDSRYLELLLFSTGHAIFFKDDIAGYVIMNTTGVGVLDIYGNPIERIAENGFTGYYNDTLNPDNSVLIFNNLLKSPTMILCEKYAMQLCNIDRTIDINVNAQKTPLLVKTAENERLTFKNLYKEYDGNSPIIFGEKGLNDKAFGVLKTDAPFNAPALFDLKAKIWNEALTFLGVSNLQINKKERLITDEVMRSQGGTIANRYSYLSMRETACKQINEIFPELNVSCVYREDISGENSNSEGAIINE